MNSEAVCAVNRTIIEQHNIYFAIGEIKMPDNEELRSGFEARLIALQEEKETLIELYQKIINKNPSLVDRYYKELYRRILYSAMISQLLESGSTKVIDIYNAHKDSNEVLFGSADQFIHQMGTCWNAMVYNVELFNKCGRIPKSQPDYEFLQKMTV